MMTRAFTIALIALLAPLPALAGNFLKVGDTVCEREADFDAHWQASITAHSPAWQEPASCHMIEAPVEVNIIERSSCNKTKVEIISNSAVESLRGLKGWTDAYVPAYGKKNPHGC